MIKKHKSGCYKIRVPLYEWDFWVAPAPEAAELLTGEAESVRDACVLSYEDDPPIVIFSDQSHNTIAHECTHICSLLMADKGMTYEVDNDEPMAYLMGYIAEQVYEVLSRDS